MHASSDPSTDAAGENARPAAHEAAYAVLEPLAGLLLSRQTRYSEAEDLLKTAFVHASARAFVAQGKVPTVSNLSVATGIRRREVQRLLELPPGGVVSRPTAASQARLRWATDTMYLDAAGQPRRLPRTAPEGEASFARLAASVSKDMHARALLDEMLRIGAVDVDGDYVTLLQREFQPARTDEELLRAGGANVGDHLSAVLINLLSGPSSLLERAIVADGLTQSSARHGAELARDAWQEIRSVLREKLQALSEIDEGATDSPWRMRIGMYAYFAPEERPVAPISPKRRKPAEAVAKSRPKKRQPAPSSHEK